MLLLFLYLNFLQDLSEENYKGPAITADVLAELFPDEDSRGDVYILDVAAGSGFAGEKVTFYFACLRSF